MYNVYYINYWTTFDGDRNRIFPLEIEERTRRKKKFNKLVYTFIGRELLV